MSMFSGISLLLGALLLGSLPNPNSTVQLDPTNMMASTAGGGCCQSQPCCNADPCNLDPPEEEEDILEIPTNDTNLQILLGLKWPLKDWSWFLKRFQYLVKSGHFETHIATTTTASTAVSSEVEVLEQAFAANLSLVSQIIQKNTTSEQLIALTAGKAALKNRIEIEEKNPRDNPSFEKGSPSRKHLDSFRRTHPISTSIAKIGFILGHATLDFANKTGLPIEAIKALPLIGPISGSDELQAEFGRPQFELCELERPYRNQDGSCNNIDNPSWGASFIPYLRDLPANYSNGVSTFRKSVTGFHLPSARAISTTINNARSVDSPSFSILLMTYGQFVDHDLTAAPTARGYKGTLIKCCYVPVINPECAPIRIPLNDSFYRSYNQTCMEFVRSAPATEPHMSTLGPRNQLNQKTAYLDASVIYDSTLSTTNELRSYNGGLLKGQITAEGEFLLPPDKNEHDDCNTKEEMKRDRYCFKSGDGRANEQILLTFFQTLWAREHNRVATKLKEWHEKWDDEKLFQETRRIVTAEFQQVTYKEYLQLVIGRKLMKSSKLLPLKGGSHTDDYNSTLNAGIANSFAAAAYRFGHSLISDNLLSVTKYGRTNGTELSSMFFKPFQLYDKNGVTDIVRGGLNLPEKLMDPYFTLQVTNLLFRGNQPFGLDLLAINIQRGRDHGLRSYNHWRVFCKLRKAHHFDDLLADMDKHAVDALKAAYNGYVDDIDLYAGGVSENPVPGSIVGPTFTCLIHNQFFKAKYGDRFWFEYNGSDNPGRFTGAQVRQLHSVRLARIMCNNMPELRYIQRWPLRNPGPKNPKVCCKSVRQYNLEPWSGNYLSLDVDNYTYIYSDEDYYYDYFDQR